MLDDGFWFIYNFEFHAIIDTVDIKTEIENNRSPYNRLIYSNN